jgi:hypothetical protein
MAISKAVRTRKLKEVKKKLSDISDLLESISAEDEKYLATTTEEKISEQLAFASDTIASAALAVQSAILLVEAVAESEQN